MNMMTRPADAGRSPIAPMPEEAYSDKHRLRPSEEREGILFALHGEHYGDTGCWLDRETFPSEIAKKWPG